MENIIVNFTFTRDTKPIVIDNVKKEKKKNPMRKPRITKPPK